jgi:hypothetical protein
MARCASVETVERAALLLVGAGVSPAEFATAVAGSDPGALSWLAGAMDADVSSLAEHARTCVRCRDWLQLFMETEIRLREELLASERLSPPSGGILPLRPARLRNEGRHSPGAIEDEPGYSLAADTGGGSGTQPPQVPVLTLSTEDDRFVVRVFRNEGRAGATAVLLPVDPAQTEVASNWTLRMGGVEYPFDGRGIAQLPAFPVQDVALVRHDSSKEGGGRA